MTYGKNPGLKEKKGGKKIIDPWLKKEWYQIRAPNVFEKRDVGFTLCNKTQGLINSRDLLMGRKFTVSLGDLKSNSEEDAFRLFKLKVEEVQGNQLLTQFDGMDMTRDHLCSLIRKWHSLIECHLDINTTDGYRVRLFCIGFTKRAKNQNRKTSYAQSAQKRKIRKVMTDVMQRVVSQCNIQELVKRLIPETIGREIEKTTQKIYPLQNVHIRKVKIIRAPKTDLNKLLEAHSNTVGKKVKK